MKYKFKTAGKLTSFTPKNGLWNKSGIGQQRKMPSLIYFDPVWVGLKIESDTVNVIASAFRMSNFYPISLPIFIHMTWTIWYGPYDMDYTIWLDWIPTIFRGPDNLEISCFRFDGVIELKKLIQNRPIFRTFWKFLCPYM